MAEPDSVAVAGYLEANDTLPIATDGLLTFPFGFFSLLPASADEADGFVISVNKLMNPQ